MKYLRIIAPLFFILAIEVLLFLTNVKAHTYLLGWDMLFPEINFRQNLLWQIFGVWQDHRAFGFYDGMATTANIVHTLFLWLLFFVLPQNLLRYTFIFLMHALGIIGMYYLLKKLFYRHLPSLFGALFYGLNIGIMQMFYAPLEVFAVHFAALPALTYSLLSFLQKPTKKHLVLFFLFSVLSLPQAFVPQVFLSCVILLLSILGIYLWIVGKTAIKPVIIILLTVLCVNAYWALPYAFGISHNAAVIISSKINQSADPTIASLNHQRGGLFDVLFLKGFMLDTSEQLPQKGLSFIMPQWRDFTNSPLFYAIATLFVLLLGIGIFQVFVERRKSLYPFLIVFFISGFFLGNAIWGLNILNSILRFLLPIFNEAFRFPFTKFETLFVFCYSILLTFGIVSLPRFFAYIKETNRVSDFLDAHPLLLQIQLLPQNIKITYLSFFGFAILFVCLGLYAFPLFQGNFLYNMVQLPLPQDYQQTIAYFQHQNPNARIATLPQPSFWNWEYHDDGYRGSGFLWYGIPQAMTERSFDPWSSQSEQFYWELSQAVYANDASLLKSVLQKYTISYVMLDRHRIYPFAPTSTLIEQTQNLLQRAGFFHTKTFGEVDIYQSPTRPSFVTEMTNLPLVNSYDFSHEDMFYLQHGDYISTSHPSFDYPFRSLFTDKTASSPSIQQNATTILFSSVIPSGMSHILIPSFSQSQILIPVSFSLKNTGDTQTLVATISEPTISLGGQKIWQKEKSFVIATLPQHPVFPLHVSVNGTPFFSFSSYTNVSFPTSMLALFQDNSITVTDAKGGGVTTTIPSQDILSVVSSPVSITFTPTTQPLLLTISTPKVTDPTYAFQPDITQASVSNCSNLSAGTISSHLTQQTLSLTSQNADACFSFWDRNALSSQGYVAFLTHQHHSGQQLSFWAEDQSLSYAFSQTSVPNTNVLQTTPLILPPLQPQNIGYSLHIDNVSNDFDPTQNSIQSLSLFPIPYSFLQTIALDTGVPPQAITTKNLSVSHPNPSLFITTNLTSQENATLTLSQAFNSGWHAYLLDTSDPNFLQEFFPFFFGKNLSPVEVNNWQNGWTLPSTLPSHNSVIMVFLPQYWEYLGFLILGGFVLWLGVLFLKPTNKHS